MPRNLPWLRKSPSKSKRGPSQTPQTSHSRDDSASDQDGSARPAKRPATPRASNALSRTPSSSPPPLPPTPEYMKEGLDHDDIYVMVEDEFLATARLFTKHLHHAEYKRLKSLATLQNASVTQSIARPIDPRTILSAEGKKIAEAKALAKVQHGTIAALRAGNKVTAAVMDDLDEEYDDPWMRDSKLGGLMSGSQVEHTRLDSLASGSRTRAAAGYSKAMMQNSQKTIEAPARQSARSEHDKRRPFTNHQAEESEDEDDLDVPRRFAMANSKNLKVLERSSKLVNTDDYRVRPPKHATYGVPVSKSFNVGTHPSRAGASQNTEVSSSVTARMAKRRAELAEKQLAEKKKSVLLDEIPTFLV